MMSIPITKYVFAVQVVQRQQLAQGPTALNPCMTIPHLLPSSGAGRDRVCQWFASWDLNQEIQLDVGATS